MSTKTRLFFYYPTVLKAVGHVLLVTAVKASLFYSHRYLNFKFAICAGAQNFLELLGIYNNNQAFSTYLPTYLPIYLYLSICQLEKIYKEEHKLKTIWQKTT